MPKTCCERHQAKCDAQKRLCNKIDEGYQANLIKFNKLVGQMDGEWKVMKSTVKSVRKECGSFSVPKYGLSMKR